MGKDKTIYELHTLEFLNARIDEIYHRKKHFASGKDTMFLKGMMAGMLLRFERMCRYVYYSDIRIPETYYHRLFKEQFPFLYERFYDKSYRLIHNGEEIRLNGIAYFTLFLERLRNINLHAVISTPLAQTMQIDPDFICEFPKISECIVYIKNGVLTVAGMLIMAYSVMRANAQGSKDKGDINNDLKKSINYFSNIWGDAIWGAEWKRQKSQELYKHLETVFHTNFGINIREPVITDDILKMLFGDLYDVSDFSVMQKDGVTCFSLDLSNREGAPYFGVSGSLSFADGAYTLVIDKGSNIGEYFAEDYVLQIKDKTHFMRLCNLVPAFMCVAYMHHNAVTEPSQLSPDSIERMKKLNKPKFYCDKGMTILCSGTRYADMREINKSLTEGMMRFLLRLENDVIFRRDITVYSGYSKLADVLGTLAISEDLKEKVIAIRNFCAHYGILNNYYCYCKGNGYYIDIPFVIQTIYRLFEELESGGYKKLAQISQVIFHDNVINNLIGVKYKRLFEDSVSLFFVGPDLILRLIDALDRSWRAVENSVIDCDAEKILMRSGLHFNFKIKKNLLLSKKDKFEFDTLNLMCVEGDGLMFRGCKVAKSKLMFFQSDRTDPDSFCIGNQKAELVLVSEQQIGVVRILNYKAVAKNEA